MPLRVYNTLSRKKEAFVPLHGKRVSMFVCGITPQDQTHLGHAKTYVAFDVIARYLRSKGYHVFYLQNVTDIEDRIIAKMKSTRRAWDDIVAQYFAEFRDVMERLQCTSVDVYAFATDYIDEIVEQIQGLIRKGHAYVAEDKSVYFDTTTFSGWGKLSGQKVEELRPGARIEIEERKRHPADFVLWRAQKPGEPAWDSPSGPGRPGWHIEDTAITIRHFGAQYDLHGGGTELAFPHHEAEIAQAESFTGVTPFVRYWMHGGMVMVSGAEMHKSLGNFWPARSTSPPNCSRKPSAPTSASGKRFARSRLSVAERRRRGKRTRGSEMRRRILSRPSTPRCRTTSTLARRLRSYSNLRGTLTRRSRVASAEDRSTVPPRLFGR